MCARYGYLLGKPGISQDQESMVGEKYARNCQAYGEPAPASAQQLLTHVTLPDPEIMRAGMPDESTKSQVTSCTQCKNYVPEHIVMSELGWVGGLCSQSGRILLANRLPREAQVCEWRMPGSQRATTSGLTLKPVYDEAFGGSATIDPIATFKDGDEISLIEPHDWESEKDVTDTERASGIRAWRKIIDPKGSGNYTFLPIYDPAALDAEGKPLFSEEDIKRIPRTGDDEHPELYVDHMGVVYSVAVAWIELDETPALWGIAGTGKTELFRHLAWMMQLPFDRISITESTEVDDLIGKAQYSKEKGTYFVYGRLPRAWSKPRVLCLDEPNAGQPAVWQALRPLTDNSKQLVVDQNEGEPVTRHPDCYLGMAMNPAWDIRNSGVNQLADADGSRLFHVMMELPPTEVEKHIMRKRCELDGWEIDSKKLELIMGVASDIREACDNGTLPISWGVRNQIKVARAMRWFDPLTAYRRAVGDSLEPQVADQVMEFVRSYVR